jgi:hypothetical protein
MSLRILRVGLWSGLGATLVVTAYLLVNTTFMPYDDEGYMLISFRNYLTGLRLYDDVFSQYGPWPYVYHELITQGQPALMTHSLGRALTILHWVSMALLCGVLSWRLTRSQLAALVTAVITFGLCWQNTSEPSHPGSHITVLVSLAAVLVSLLADTRRPVLVYAGLGIIAAFLLLTKINVGLLLVAALGCIVLRYTAWPERWRRTGAVLAAAGLIAVPWVLLGRQLEHAWVLILALQFTLAAAGLLWVSPATSATASLPARAWLAAPLACLLAGGLVCLQAGRHGTGIDSLLHGILLNPLRMPAHFLVGLTWYPEVWVLAGAGLVVVGKAGQEIRTQGRPALSTIRLIAGLRCVLLAVFVIFCRTWPSYFGIFHFAAYCLPLLPVFLVPLSDAEHGTRQLARWAAAVVALLQVLHVFPVAGSQLAWATFLCVPVLMAGLFDLRVVLPDLLPKGGRGLIRAGGIALIVAAMGQLGLLAHTGWQRYTHSRPLDLPGAGDIRLDGTTRQTFRLLNLNASIHADLLFSRQGMFSHNLWSGIPTPTAQNATHWFWLLNEARQREIVARLAATPRTALITARSLDEFMAKQNIPLGGPLHEFVQHHYRPLFQYGDFTFHVPSGSRAEAFGRFALLTPEADAGTILVRSNVLLDGQPARIGLEMINSPWTPGPDLLTPQAQAIAEPINREGQPAGEPVPLPSPRPLRGLYRLSVICPRLPPKLPWQEYAVVVRDADGRVLSESVYY